MPDRSPRPFNSVARPVASFLASPVAPFSGSPRERWTVSARRDTCAGDCLSSGAFPDGFADFKSDELDTRREACCLEDAVFSRTPNWVGRDFIFAKRSL